MDPGFQTFSTEHFITLAVFIAFTILVIKVGARSDERAKILIGFSIATASQAVMIIDLCIRLMTHTLDVLNDLPLFLCDLIALILPFMILRQDRKWLGILYFWAVGGTLQALITPQLGSGFPTFEFFRYFIMHGGIVVAMIYSVIVFRIRITWKDLWNAVLYVQIYLIGIHIINMLLGSNYSYTVAKPGSATILDFLGDWPWYILATEIVMILLFILLLSPFLLFPGNKDQEESLTTGQTD